MTTPKPVAISPLADIIADMRAERLQLPPMTVRNGDKKSTALTVSIEAAEGVTTGISAANHARTVQGVHLAQVKGQWADDDAILARVAGSIQRHSQSQSQTSKGSHGSAYLRHGRSNLAHRRSQNETHEYPTSNAEHGRLRTEIVSGVTP